MVRSSKGFDPIGGAPQLRAAGPRRTRDIEQQPNPSLQGARNGARERAASIILSRR